MEPEVPAESQANDDAFIGHIAHENVESTPDALQGASSQPSPAVLSTLLNVREPSFLDTQTWHSKSSSQLQQPPARSKKSATALPPVLSPPRQSIPPVSQAAILRYKLTLGDGDGMFDPVRRYNEVAHRMKASISRALARPVPSPRNVKPISKPSPSSPVVGDSKQKLWSALPALPRLFGDLQRAAGGIGRSAEIGAAHWLAWCSDQEALGRVPHVTRAAGLETLVASGYNGSFKLSLEQFSQCILMLAAKVLELESTSALPPSSSEPSPHSAAVTTSQETLSPADPSPPVPLSIQASAAKLRARACSSQHVKLCKSFLKRLATANPPSPPVHERSRRSCKSSAWFGKVPAIDKLYNQLGGALVSREAFVAAVVSARGESAPCSEDLLGFAFDWAGNICNTGQLNDDQTFLDYDGLWQAVLYACGHCNSSSAPPIRCSSSALRAVHTWSSSWTFAAQQSPPPRTAVLPSVSTARPATTSQGLSKAKTSAAALSNYVSILGGVDPNFAEKSHAELDEAENEPHGHSVSFAEHPPPSADRNVSPTRLASSRGDRGSTLESRAGSRHSSRHQELSRPVTGIGGFSLPTVLERLRTSPIRQHGTTTLVSGVVKSPGPNPLVKQPHPVLDKAFAGRVNQAKFTFQPEFSSQRVFGHYVSRDVVLGPVPRHLLNIPATAELSFRLQASPPRRYPEGKNINPQWANKLDVNDELFDKSLKGHEVRSHFAPWPAFRATAFGANFSH
jgi:hypothetical protein